MFTPQGRGTPSRVLTRSAERRERGKLLLPEFGSAAGRSGGLSPGQDLLGVPGSSNSSPEDNQYVVAAADRSRSEQEIWKQFKDAGALDEESLEKKDRAALLAHISTLESELYDYQYQMGLLLLESKSWGPKFEKMKGAIADAEENLKREQAAHMIAITEAERREDALKKALLTEKQCVADLEKALKEMQAELAEVKEDAARQLAQAKNLLVGMEEKSVNADSRLHAGEAILAQASRKQADVERKLQEVQAREDALRRQQQEFKVNCEARIRELDHEEENLKEWEKRLRDGQNRLLDGETILNKREEFVNQKDLALKKLEEDLKVARKELEQSRLQFQQDEIDLKARITAISLREESAVKKEVALDKKEQELLLLQERIASRECFFEQHERHVRETEIFNCKERERLEALESSLKVREDSFSEKKQELDNLMKALEETRNEEVRTKLELQSTIDELERLRESMKVEQEELEKKRQSCMVLEAEMNQKEEKLLKKEQQMEKKAEKLKEREKDLDGKMKGVKERERGLKNEEKRADAERQLIEQEKEGLIKEKEELEKLRLEILAENQKIKDEKEKLRAVEQEREDLLHVKTQLKGEIDELRAQKQEIIFSAEELKKEKERFEKEWELLDEKNEQVRKERDSLEQESRRISKWVHDEEERIKKEKRDMHERNYREHEILRAEKEALLNTSETDKRNLFEMVQKERDDLVRDIELHRGELERSVEKRKTEVEKEAEDLKLKLNEELHQAQEEIRTSREMIQRELEEITKQRSKVEKEKQEMTKQRKEAEEKWLEIKKDIEELQLQQEKLKEQRESLRNERAEVLMEVERLKKLRDELKEGDESIQISEQQPSHNYANDNEVLSPQELLKTGFSNNGGPKEKTLSVGVNAAVASESSPSKLAMSGRSLTPGSLSWLQRCASRLFPNSGDKAEPNTLHGGSNGSATSINPSKLEQSKLTEPSPKNNNHRPDAGIIVAIHEQEVRNGPDPTESPSHSQKNVSRSTEKVYSRTRRTRSIKAVVEDAKFILQETAAGRANEAVLAEHEESEKEKDHAGEEFVKGGFEVSTSTHQDSRQVPSEDNTDHRGTRGGRKRGRRLSKIAVEEKGDTPEVNSDISIGGGKKKRRKEAAIVSSTNGDTGKGSLVTKRYNLRHSTIVSTIATQAATGEENDMTQHVEENPRKEVRNASANVEGNMSQPQAPEHSQDKERINKREYSRDANVVQQSDHAQSSSLRESKIEALNFQELLGPGSQFQTNEGMDTPEAELGEGSSGATHSRAQKMVRGGEIESTGEETSEGEAQLEQDYCGDDAAESVEDDKDGDVETSSEDEEDENLEDDRVLEKDQRPLGKKLWDFLTT